MEEKREAVEEMMAVCRKHNETDVQFLFISVVNAGDDWECSGLISASNSALRVLAHSLLQREQFKKAIMDVMIAEVMGSRERK